MPNPKTQVRQGFLEVAGASGIPEGSDFSLANSPGERAEIQETLHNQLPKGSNPTESMPAPRRGNPKPKRSK